LAISAGAAEPETAATVDVALSGLRSGEGQLLACLTSDPKAFPGCQKDPHALRLTVPARAPHLHFSGVRSGTWALAVVHDENGNGRMDMTLFLPREGVGVSRNPRPRMGPPTFESAAFAVGGRDVSLAVEMKYML